MLRAMDIAVATPLDDVAAAVAVLRDPGLPDEPWPETAEDAPWMAPSMTHVAFSRAVLPEP